MVMFTKINKFPCFRITLSSNNSLGTKNLRSIETPLPLAAISIPILVRKSTGTKIGISIPPIAPVSKYQSFCASTSFTQTDL